MYTGRSTRDDATNFSTNFDEFTFGDKFSNFNNHFITAANERNNYAIAHTIYRFIADYNNYRPALVTNTANIHRRILRITWFYGLHDYSSHGHPQNFFQVGNQERGTSFPNGVEGFIFPGGTPLAHDCRRPWQWYAVRCATSMTWQVGLSHESQDVLNFLTETQT